LAVLLFFSASCNANNNRKPNDLPGMTIPLEEMNTAFVIEDLPLLGNSHKNGEYFELAVRNLSDKTIVLPNDYGLSIFAFQDQIWNLVNNRNNYADSENLLLTSDAFPPGLAVVAYPYIPSLLEPTKLRIVMIGHNENSVTEVVGAYIDIILLP
jgi:hypothetical protein